jgi:predicted thioredoxin/glutaredoxin
VLWVRVAIAVPSVLVAVLLMLAGIFFPHVTFDQGTASGVVTRTVDVGPEVAILVAVLLAVTALFAWLAKFALFRVVLLVLTLVSVVSALSQLADAVSAERAVYLLVLGWDILYAGLLGLSLVAPRPR